jgi:hypothetical protein
MDARSANDAAANFRHERATGMFIWWRSPEADIALSWFSGGPPKDVLDHCAANG